MCHLFKKAYKQESLPCHLFICLSAIQLFGWLAGRQTGWLRCVKNFVEQTTPTHFESPVFESLQIGITSPPSVSLSVCLFIKHVFFRMPLLADYNETWYARSSSTVDVPAIFSSSWFQSNMPLAIRIIYSGGGHVIASNGSCLESRDSWIFTMFGSFEYKLLTV